MLHLLGSGSHKFVLMHLSTSSLKTHKISHIYCNIFLLCIAALNLDPKNAPAQEGLQKIEQCTGGDGGGGGGNTLEVTYGLDEMEDGGMNSDEVNTPFNIYQYLY